MAEPTDAIPDVKESTGQIQPIPTKGHIDDSFHKAVRSAVQEFSEAVPVISIKLEKDAQETTVLKKEIKEEPVDNIARPGEHLIISQRSSELMENEQCEKTEDAGEHLIISQRSSELIENVQCEKAKDAGDGSAYVEPPAHSTAPPSSEEASVNTTDQPELIEATADMQPANAIHRCPTCNDEFSSSSELMFHEERHRSGGSDRINSVPNNSTQATISTANEEAISDATASDLEGNRTTERADWEPDSNSEDVYIERSTEDEEYIDSEGASSKRRSQRLIQKSEEQPNTTNVLRKESAREPDNFACLDCPTICKTEMELRNHISTHSGYLRYQCSYCEKRFKTACQLSVHQRIHTGEKPFKCQTCGVSFASKKSLLNHQRIHIGKFICVACDKTFNSKRELKYHHLTYPGGKPFKCKFCGLRYKLEASRKKHARTHTGPTPYQCLMCKQKFTTSEAWNQHVKSHPEDAYENYETGGKRPHRCNECGLTFAQISQLVIHQISHSADKPFICNFCDWGFRQASNLSKHLSTHQGSKPYLCIVCKVPFSTKDEMVTHKKQAHEDDGRTLDSFPTRKEMRPREIDEDSIVEPAVQQERTEREFCWRESDNNTSEARQTSTKSTNNTAVSPVLVTGTLNANGFLDKECIADTPMNDASEYIDHSSYTEEHIADDFAASATPHGSGLHQISHAKVIGTTEMNIDVCTSGNYSTVTELQPEMVKGTLIQPNMESNGGTKGSTSIENQLDSSERQKTSIKTRKSAVASSITFAKTLNGNESPLLGKESTDHSARNIIRESVGRSSPKESNLDQLDVTTLEESIGIAETRIAEIRRALTVKRQLDSQSTHRESSSTRKRKELDNTESQSIPMKMARKSTADGSSASETEKCDKQEPFYKDRPYGSDINTSGKTRKTPSADKLNISDMADNERRVYKTNCIGYVIEKNAKKNPNTLHIIWSEEFSLDLAAAISNYRSNCLLFVKKAPFFTVADVTYLKFSLQSPAVNVAFGSENLYCFDFGELNLPMKASKTFDSYAKVEAKMRKFARSKGMNIVNILRFSMDENSWSNYLLPQLKGECIIANTV